jgi:hypothetical protein
VNNYNNNRIYKLASVVKRQDLAHYLKCEDDNSVQTLRENRTTVGPWTPRLSQLSCEGPGSPDTYYRDLKEELSSTFIVSLVY